MAGAIRCTCGATLVEEVTSAGVRPPGGEAVIPFRRTTDYVICSNCLLAYDVRSLIELTETREIIQELEQLAENAERSERE